MKSVLLILFLISPLLNALAQDHQDSILIQIKSAEGKDKADLLNKAFWNYIYSQPEYALPFVQQALELSRKIEYTVGEIDGLNRIGVYYDVTGKYDSAIYFYEQSLQLAYAVDNKKKIAGGLNNIGLAYWHIGDYQRSLEHYLRSLPYFKAADDLHGLGSAYNNIGLIYKDWRNHEKSLEFQLKAMEIRQKIDDKGGLGASLTNIGLLYDQLGDLEKAKQFLRQSMQLKEEINDVYGLSLSANGLGSVYMKEGEYPQALEYFEQSISYSRKVNDIHAQIISWLNIFDIHRAAGQTEKALQAINTALALSGENKSLKLKYRIYESLARIYYEKGDFKKAFDYYNSYSVIKDSVLNEQQIKQINDLQTNYEIEKGKDEIALLTRQRKIQDLQIEKQQLLIGRRNSLISAIVVIFLLVLAVIYLFYQRKEHKQKVILHEERLKQQQMRSRAVMEAEERERRRIGTELHDGLGHLLSIIKLNLSAYNEKKDVTDSLRETYVSNATVVVDDVFREVRNISHNMMSDAVMTQGLTSAVKNYLDKINVTQKLKVNFESIGTTAQLDPVAQNVLFRVVQEAINNTIKHADATEIFVQIVADQKDLTIMIEDNGKGFDMAKMNGSGIGLKNIYSRIEGLNGTAFIDASVGRGTIVNIEVPLG